MKNLPSPPRVLRPWAVHFFSSCYLAAIILLGSLAFVGLEFSWPWLASAGPFWGVFWQIWVTGSILLLALFITAWLFHGLCKLRKPRWRAITALAAPLAKFISDFDSSPGLFLFALFLIAIWPVVVVILVIILYWQELHPTYVAPVIRELFTQPAPNGAES